eukprot:3424433-Pyramimonas_sp.AAC.1
MATMHATGIDGETDLLPHVGTTMGHSMAAGDFVDIYSPTVDSWNNEIANTDISHGWFRGPSVTGNQGKIAIGVGLFVDDVTRLHVHACPNNS